MKIEDWKDVDLIDGPIVHPRNDEGYQLQKRKSYVDEFNYCMPLCKDEGWFFEFGVFTGTTINTCSKLRPNNHFYGFDSFEGLPEEWKFLNPNDSRVKSSKKMPAGHFALDKLPKVNDNVTLVKGFYDQSLIPWRDANMKEGDTISWLHMDADLYSSTIFVLNALNEYIVPGTVIRFDELVDWRLEGFPCQPGHDKPKPKYSNWPEGEWKALLEWMNNHDRQVKPKWRDWHQGAGLIVTK